MKDLGKKVIYQIYPKSFYDSNHDGLGDIRGIIEKIDYLKQLNVDMIWFNPFFTSPMMDNGYDIENYRQIDPKFGTMEDFEELVTKLKDIGIDVMLDMVFNHCSTKHEWFRRALAGEKKYQNYFYLRPAKADGSLPTNWKSKFGGPAWEKFGETDLYYLHLYHPMQADLNWHNPDVRQEAIDIVNFWIEKGVKGFRFDVINVIGKEEENFIDSTSVDQEKALYTDTPIVHRFIHELNQKSFGQLDDAITVGEMSSTSIENSIRYSRPDAQELDMIFQFHHLKVDYENGKKWTVTPFDFKSLKKIFNDWEVQMTNGGGWNALFWNNHDQPWALNRFGEVKKYRIKSAQMLASTLHLMRGTPFIYNGEEIGRIDPHYSTIKSYKDPEALNAYQELLDQGYSKEEAFKRIQAKARDNSRTPMPWDETTYAGFSSTQPWLEPTDQKDINVKKELKEGEIFSFYQQLIQLRHTLPIISEGDFNPLFPEDEHVLAYKRTLKDETLIVFSHFYNNTYRLVLPKELQLKGKVLVSNYNREMTELNSVLTLQPYETLAFYLKKI